MSEEYTNIRIKKSSKDKMKVLQSVSGLTYSEIIEKLITGMGGMIQEDIITIQREQVAFTLNYWDNDKTIKKDVTYWDLHNSDVGDIFKITFDEDLPDNYITSFAEVISKEYDTHNQSVVLKMSNLKVENRKPDLLTNISHILLF